MFNVEGTTISLSCGDTGAIKFIADTDYTFASEDRALFSIKNSVGEVVKESAYALDNEKSFTVTFFNSDTDNLAPGTFNWDVRYIIHPYYDDAGKIIDGDQVITPNAPMDMNLLNVVGVV